MKNYQDIIIRPLVTENTMDLIQYKTYGFEVLRTATKPDIAHAIEEMFGVKVASVNTINMKRKPKRLGVHEGYTRAWKKAIVTLTADSKTIEFFDGLM